MVAHDWLQKISFTTIILNQ